MLVHGTLTLSQRGNTYNERFVPNDTQIRGEQHDYPDWEALESHLKDDLKLMPREIEEIQMNLQRRGVSSTHVQVDIPEQKWIKKEYNGF